MRPSIHEYMTSLLPRVAARSTCARRAVGCIITDAKGVILATGYNGVPSGFAHCMVRDIDGATLHDPKPGISCDGAFDEPGDTRRCFAVHAEQNALLQCRELPRAAVLYVSVSPCFTCAKMILNTSIKTIVVKGLYADQAGLDVLRAGGVLVVEVL